MEIVCSDLLSCAKKQNNRCIPKILYTLWVHNKQIIDCIQSLAKKYPNNYWLSLYLADIYIRENKITDAKRLLEECMLHNLPEKLQSKVKHQLALLTNGIKNV